MINTWNESLLHEELKDLYCGETGMKEVSIGGSICDVVRQDGSLIEIQTSSIGKLRDKLERLLQDHALELVHPIAVNSIIETYNPDGSLKSRRKSPKHGSLFQLFNELTGIYQLLDNPNLTLTVVLADILEIRVADGTGSWRRKGIRLDDRKLIKIHETVSFRSLSEYASLLPASLSTEFTTTDLSASGAGRFAGKMAWVLKKAGVLEIEGKRGRAYLYRRIQDQARTGRRIETVVPRSISELTVTLPL